MKLTTKGRYAVMAMAEIALQSMGLEQEAAPISCAKIAERQNISPLYLEQILVQLKQNGLIDAIKGPGGGYFITKNIKELRLLDIIKAVDEKTKMTLCSTKGCPDKKNKGICLTHNLWSGLSYHIEAYFASISLFDLCANKTNSSFYRESMRNVNVF